MTTILLGGALANKYLNGGAVWTRLSWILGLSKLGFDVHFVEQIERAHCVDASGAVTSFETCANLAFFKRVTEQFGLADSATLLYEDGEQTHGLTAKELLDLAEAADLLVNITGHVRWEPLLRRLRRKVFVDLDPGFTQFWHADGNPGARLAGHDWHFTVGENIGSPHCAIPTGDVHWRRTRQPVVVEHWPVVHAERKPAADRFTTIASWRGPYGRVQHSGRTFGLKAHEFRKFVELPARVQPTFEIALDIHPGDASDRDLLSRHRWSIVDPRVTVPDPSSFRRYIQRSGAEFSVAQGIYVETTSGWFSDRTVRYLASGKPALVQDTGFSRNLPVGDGLIAFRTLEDAIAGAEQIARDYDHHCRAARALAESYFDSNKVLGQLIEDVGIAP